VKIDIDRTLKISRARTSSVGEQIPEQTGVGLSVSFRASDVNEVGVALSFLGGHLDQDISRFKCTAKGSRFDECNR